MSTSSRHRTKRERDLDRMLRRLRQREKAPLRVPDRTAPTPPVPAPEPPSAPALVSVIPEWTRVLPLPPEIPQAFRAWLFRHIQTQYAPADSHEHYLAARIALALARQHLSAARESNQPDSLWIRYETLADRQLRQALNDWNDHRKSKPVADVMPSSSSPLPSERSAEGRMRGQHDDPTSTPQTTPPEPPNPQTPPNPHNTNLADSSHPPHDVPRPGDLNRRPRTPTSIVRIEPPPIPRDVRNANQCLGTTMLSGGSPDGVP